MQWNAHSIKVIYCRLTIYTMLVFLFIIWYIELCSFLQLKKSWAFIVMARMSRKLLFFYLAVNTLKFAVFLLGLFWWKFACKKTPLNFGSKLAKIQLTKVFKYNFEDFVSWDFPYDHFWIRGVFFYENFEFLHKIQFFWEKINFLSLMHLIT